MLPCGTGPALPLSGPAGLRCAISSLRNVWVTLPFPSGSRSVRHRGGHRGRERCSWKNTLDVTGWWTYRSSTCEDGATGSRGKNMGKETGNIEIPRRISLFKNLYRSLFAFLFIFYSTYLRVSCFPSFLILPCLFLVFLPCAARLAATEFKPMTHWTSQSFRKEASPLSCNSPSLL